MTQREYRDRHTAQRQAERSIQRELGRVRAAAVRQNEIDHREAMRALDAQREREAQWAQHFHPYQEAS